MGILSLVRSLRPHSSAAGNPPEARLASGPGIYNALIDELDIARFPLAFKPGLQRTVKPKNSEPALIRDVGVAARPPRSQRYQGCTSVVRKIGAKSGSGRRPSLRCGPDFAPRGSGWSETSENLQYSNPCPRARDSRTPQGFLSPRARG